MPKQQYFATLSGKELGKALKKRVDNYYNKIEKSGKLEKLKYVHNAYYGINGKGKESSNKIQNDGDDGQLSVIKINTFRKFVRNTLARTLTSRPDFTARAKNTDHKSLQQADLAKGILDSYLREENLEQYLIDCMEAGFLLSEGYISYEWDEKLGKTLEVINPETGIPDLKEGDLRFRLLNVLDLIRPSHKRWDENEWVIIRVLENKFSLAEKHPELKDEILKLSMKNDDLNKFSFYDYTFSEDEDECIEDIYSYIFYHIPTEALPNGKMVKFLSADIVLSESGLPYDSIPVAPLLPATKIGSGEGYSDSFDLLGPQQGIDAIWSSIITNVLNYGNEILMFKNIKLSDYSVIDGHKVIEVDGNGSIEPVTLAKVSPDSYKTAESLLQLQQMMSGHNDVSMGQVKGDMSGSAMALIESMATQANSGFQRAVAKLIETLGTGVIRTLRSNAKTQRMVAIAGVNNRSSLQHFSGDDLVSVDRIVVEVSNPVSKSGAAAQDMAQRLLDSGLITAQQFYEVYTTGKFDPITEGPHREALAIRAENEALARGEMVPVLITDDHIRHIEEHKAVGADPESRKNPELIAALTAHIMEHKNQLQMGDPFLLQLLKQPVPAPAPAPGQSGGGAPAGEAGEAGMPNPPTNPLTGEQTDLPEPEL